MAYSYKFKLLYTAFLQNIKLSGYKVEIKFHKDSLVVEQENYKTKNIDAYIVYDLSNSTNNPLRNFTLKDVKLSDISVNLSILPLFFFKALLLHLWSPWKCSLKVLLWGY